MVSASQGTLLECDNPLKEYIAFLDESLLPKDKFIVRDLGDTHVVIKAESLPFVEAKIKELYDKINFVPPTKEQQ